LANQIANATNSHRGCAALIAAASAGQDRRAKIADVSEVTVLVFGPLRERVGVAELRGHGTTVAEVWAELADAHHIAAVPDGIRAARNLEYCEWNTSVSPGDVIAFLPPVAGGSGVAADERVRVEISDEPIVIGAAIDIAADEDGAVAVFIGTVRNHSDGHAVSRIDYEAYPAMAESEMRRIAMTLIEREGVSRVAMTHRVGTLEVGDASVVIAVSGPHRAEALAACHDAIDMIKESVPIWKREHRDDGAHWVDARHR
jgi:molybdopterin synthase catalytic subunit